MADRIPRLTAAEVVRKLQRAGWQITRQTGGHVHLAHPHRPGVVTVSMHTGTVPVGTMGSILSRPG